MVVTIPRGAAAFDGYFKNLSRYVGMKCGGAVPDWTHIPSEAQADMRNAYAFWDTVYAVTLKPCTSPERAEKRRVQDVSDKFLRNFINIYLRYHPAVTAEDKENMGIRVAKEGHSVHTPPDTAPFFSIIQLGPRTLGIIFRHGPGGRKGSRPPYVKGARIHMGVFDTPPLNQEDLPASRWATKCPFIFTFRECDRGKRAYFAVRWELGKENGEGPWSEILSEIIP